MRRWQAFGFVGFAALLAGGLGACSGSEVQGRVAVAVQTALEPATVAAGDTSQVVCTVLGPQGQAIHEGETTFTLDPAEGVGTEGTTLTGQQAGTYQVHCAADLFHLRDDEGATLTVVPGAPVKVTAVLDSPSIQVHQQTGVECVAEDAFGNVAQVATTVSASEGATVTPAGDAGGAQVGSSDVGEYDVTCSLADPSEGAPEGVEEVPATLEVTPGDPAEVELKAKPALNWYSVGDVVQIFWVVRDAYGNELPGDPPLPGTLSIPPAGLTTVNAEEHRYKFDSEGIFTFSVTLDAPYDLLTDDLELLVDDSGPQITIKWPSRGQTLAGDGSPMEIGGTIVEDYGEIQMFRINGQDITPAPDGTFKATIQPGWGVNVIDALAADNHGNVTKLTPTFQYAKGYTSFNPDDGGGSAKGVKTDDGVGLLLGQAFLDDGDHDLTHPNDLATILELLLGETDLQSLVAGMGGFNTSIPILNPPELNIGVAKLKLTGTLDLGVELVDPTDIGPTSVTIDSRTGGIDSAITFGNDDELGMALSLKITATLVVDIDYDVFGAQGTYTPTQATTVLFTGAYADLIHVMSKIDMDMPPGGALSVNVADVAVDLVNLQLDPIQDATFDMTIDLGFWSTSFSVQLSQFFDLNALTDQLLDPLTTQLVPLLVDLVTPIIQQFAGGLLEQLLGMLEIDTTFPLPDLFGTGAPPTDLGIYTNLTSVKFEDDGGQLGLSLGVYGDKGVQRDPLGAIQRGGCLAGLPQEFNYDWDKSVGLALNTDAVNAALFAVWWTGFLNGPLDLSALGGGGGGGGISLDGTKLDLNWLLPPILYDCDPNPDIIEVQVGDLFAHIEASILGMDINADLYIDAGVELSISSTEEGLFVTIGDFTYFDVEVVDMVEVENSLIDVRDFLENSLEGLLGSFVTGQTLGPLAIPPLDISTLVPGLPPGAAFQLGDIGVTKDTGYVVLGADLQ